MEAKAEELLVAFKNPNLSVDSKIAHIASIKSDIKQKNVPEGAITTIFDTLRLAITSQHSSVSSAGFSTLGHFLKRLSIQDQQPWILSQARNFYPILMERLGDHKERVRAQSASIFTELWAVSTAEAEYYVLDCALVGKNPRAREMSLLWLANMTKNHGLLFRQYVPSLVACLEDADSAVRDTAKLVVIDLFRNAPARAKSDLQKQLSTRGVRKSIASAIISGIGLGTEPESSNRPISRAERPISVMSSRSHVVDGPSDGPLTNTPKLAIENDSDVDPEREPAKGRPGSSKGNHDRPTTSTHLEAPARPKTPAAEPPAVQKSSPGDDDVEPLLVSSGREIDDIVRDMIPWFDGRESEDNWMKREKNVILFRRLTNGNAPHDFTQNFVNGTKTLLDGFFKVVNSLRTTMSTNGCLLIQELARTCGPKIDSMVEIIMQNLIKLCGALKKIAAQNGNTTVDVVIGHVTFNIRILQHVHSASLEKNLQLRLFAAGWIKTLISRQAHHKSTIEHGGGLDLVDKSIRKGLGDANPGVREAARGTFWTFFTVWPERANRIMSDLDAKFRGLLEKDSANPNGSSVSTTPSAAKSPGGRSALKEAIAARRKAIPSRPDSAQSAFSENQASEPAPKPATRTVPTGAPLSSLSSAPVRPGMKPRRAELSRPATADPYARRPDSRTESRAQSTSKPVGSPRSVRSKASTPSFKPISAPRLRPHEASQGGTTRSKPKKLDLSKSKSHGDLAAASRARRDSAASVANKSPTHARDLNQAGALEHPNSPAQIVLESPPLFASQPQLLASKESEVELGDAPESFSEPQPLSLEDNIIMAVSPRARQREPATPSRHPDLVADHQPSPKPQPDEMVIYEDPATPVTAKAETPSIDPVEHFTPTKSPQRADGPELVNEPAVGTPVTSTTPIKNTPLEMPPQPGALADGSSESPFQSPVRRTPLRGSPSPSRNRPQPTLPDQTPDMDSASPRESSMAPSETSPTKENPQIAKGPETAVTPRSPAKAGALEEVSLNESTSRTAETRQRSVESLVLSTGEEPFRRSRKWAERHRSPSPRSKDPTNAREMIHKAPSRIASKTMDISGYRKLQGLFHYHGEEIVSRDQDYYTLLQGLLNELEAAPMSRKDHDVKTQILATVRSMLLRTSKLFHRYDIPAMAAILRARRHYESSSHFVTCLEEVVEQLVDLIPAPTVISGVLQGLDLGQEPNEDAYRTIILGLSAIHQALSPGAVEISDEVLARVGTTVSQHLGHPRPGVRKQATELCTLLNLKFGLDRVQKVAPPAGEGSLNLLTYFMARRSQ